MIKEEWIGNGSILIYIIKILVISIFTYITSIKISNVKINKKYIVPVLIIIINSIICGIINRISNFSSSIIYLVFTMSSIFSLSTKNKIGYSILINIISISINYSIFLLSTILSFILYSIIGIKYEYINFIIITIIYSIILTNILRYKKIKMYTFGSDRLSAIPKQSATTTLPKNSIVTKVYLVLQDNGVTPSSGMQYDVLIGSTKVLSTENFTTNIVKTWCSSDIFIYCDNDNNVLTITNNGDYTTYGRKGCVVVEYI